MFVTLSLLKSPHVESPHVEKRWCFELAFLHCLLHLDLFASVQTGQNRFHLFIPCNQLQYKRTPKRMPEGQTEVEKLPDGNCLNDPGCLLGSVLDVQRRCGLCGQGLSWTIK